MPGKIIFVFIDGIGLGRDRGDNPFAIASMPFLSDLLDGRLLASKSIHRDGRLLIGIDACLGVKGIPQSASGQTSLFAGINAPQLLGYHLPAFPNEPLIEVVRQRSLLKCAVEHGLRATFANAYTPNYFQLVEDGERIHSVTTHCVLAADLPFRYVADLLEGKAVYWDMTNRRLGVKHGYTVPEISSEQSGRRLAELSFEYDVVLYESFLSDVIGHSKNMQEAVNLLEDLDGLLFGIVENKPADATMILTSDHGNLEDLSTGAHTRNPVPLLAVGPEADRFSTVKSISEILGVLFPS